MADPSGDDNRSEHRGALSRISRAGWMGVRTVLRDVDALLTLGVPLLLDPRPLDRLRPAAQAAELQRHSLACETPRAGLSSGQLRASATFHSSNRNRREL